MNRLLQILSFLSLASFCTIVSAQIVLPGATNSVVIGNGSIASVPNTVSLGNAGVGGVGPSERRIVNVAPGQNETDAVTVRQLLDVANGVVASNQITQDAVTSAQTTAKQAQSRADQAQDGANRALNGDAHDRIARQIGTQAQTTADNAQATANTAQSTASAAHLSAAQAHQRIDDLERKAGRGIASALATAAAMPSGADLEPGQVAMNVGVGAYENYGAMAIGLAKRLKTDEGARIQNAVVRGALAVSNGRPAVSVGFGWKW